MNGLETGLYTYLISTTCSAFNSMISSRLYWLQAPNRVTKPYCVYQIIGDNHSPLWFNSNTGDALIQFDIIADKKSDKDVAYKLKDCLTGYTGYYGSVISIITSVSNIREFDVTDSTGPEYQFQVDISVQYEY